MNPDTPNSDRIPVAPSLQTTLDRQSIVTPAGGVPQRMFVVLCYALIAAAAAVAAAELLTMLIGLVSNLCFYGEWNTHYRLPADHKLGYWVVMLPVAGGLIVGAMARWGSKGIRGHGIPEAMEKVLTGESRVPARLTVLKPLSAAVAIGTGGPFGAEGPIIATGGALGSLLGQFVPVSAAERKVILAAGAAAGMTAIFGTPVAAVLLAIELLLFEFNPQSFIPVSAAAATAAALRLALHGADPFFIIPAFDAVTGPSILGYAVVGTLIGVLGVGITRAVYWVEDMFEHLPVHWMWWPALGGIAVGLVGIWVPRTLGVGYENITAALTGELTVSFALLLGSAKFLSWVIALGSGTSGGTLAPLLTIGGAAGAVLGILGQSLAPALAIDPRLAALVGMAAIFGASSRAFLASLFFAFESTLQSNSILPLLAGSVLSYAVSTLLMRTTIMTEKIVRRGVAVPSAYVTDILAHATAGQFASRPAHVLHAEQPAQDTAAWLASGAPGADHGGYPVVTQDGKIVGVVTRRDFRQNPTGKTLGEIATKPAVFIRESESLRYAADIMTRKSIGRLPVVDDKGKVTGILTRSDLLRAHSQRLQETEKVSVARQLPPFIRPRS